MEYPERCTASVNQIRCENPAVGESDLCKMHRKKCRKLYLNYKNVCSRIPDFDYCDIDIDTLSLQELKDLSADLKEQYISFQKCIQARDKHNANCYVLECRDSNHAIFVQKVIDAMTQCDVTLAKIYDRINREEQRIRSERLQVREIAETIGEMEREMEIPVKRLTLPTLKPISGKGEEEELLTELIKKSQSERLKEEEDEQFLDKISGILEQRPELNKWKAYFAALAYISVVNPESFAEEELNQMFRAPPNKLWYFDRKIKAIPLEFRGIVESFFTFTQSLYRIEEVKQWIIDTKTFLINSKSYVNDLIRLQRRDDDSEKLKIIEGVKDCLKVLISKNKLKANEVYDFLDANGAIDSPLLPLYRPAYFAPFIKAGKDYLDLYLRLFFNKISLSRFLYGCE